MLTFSPTGTRDGSAAPWFVTRKDAARNALIVVQGHDDPRLYADQVETGPVHWIAGLPPAAGQRLCAMTRYRMMPAACRMEPVGAERWRTSFDAAQWAPTPGQYLVAYDGDVCLGGGVIESASAEVGAVTRQSALV